MDFEKISHTMEQKEDSRYLESYRRVQKQALQVEIIYIIQILFDLFSLNLVSNRYQPVIARKKCYCTDIRMFSSCPYTTINEHDKAAEMVS